MSSRMCCRRRCRHCRRLFMRSLRPIGNQPRGSLRFRPLAASPVAAPPPPVLPPAGLDGAGRWFCSAPGLRELGSCFSTRAVPTCKLPAGSAVARPPGNLGCPMAAAFDRARRASADSAAGYGESRASAVPSARWLSPGRAARALGATDGRTTAGHFAPRTGPLRAPATCGNCSWCVCWSCRTGSIRWRGGHRGDSRSVPNGFATTRPPEPSRTRVSITPGCCWPSGRSAPRERCMSPAFTADGCMTAFAGCWPLLQKGLDA